MKYYTFLYTHIHLIYLSEILIWPPSLSTPITEHLRIFNVFILTTLLWGRTVLLSPVYRHKTKAQGDCDLPQDTQEVCACIHPVFKHAHTIVYWVCGWNPGLIEINRSFALTSVGPYIGVIFCLQDNWSHWNCTHLNQHEFDLCVPRKLLHIQPSDSDTHKDWKL